MAGLYKLYKVMPDGSYRFVSKSWFDTTTNKDKVTFTKKFDKGHIFFTAEFGELMLKAFPELKQMFI